MSDYKYINGEYFNERKHWLNDDYVKFIRYGEHYIEKNGEGILAFINPHGFLDNPTFRGMRYHLLNTFDKIYIVDLHGNGNKKEICPDGSTDENVFDIKQGVSINIFVKTKTSKKKLADIFHYDLYGKRDFKYDFLYENSLKTINWNKLEYSEPNYFFVPKDFEEQEEYNEGLEVSSLFLKNSLGVVSFRDKIVFHNTKNELLNVLNDFNDLEVENIRQKYNLPKDSNDWQIVLAKLAIKNFGNFEKHITGCSYRPFDMKWTYYINKSKGFMARPSYDIQKHLLKDNLTLIANKSTKKENYNTVFISKQIIDLHILETANASAYNFPLYFYPDKNSLTTERTPNLNMKIVKEIEKKLGLQFVNEKEQNTTTFAPIDILDYIYAVLHSPNYREKYKEFLKIDFPRVPFPTLSNFWQLVSLGGKLRALHLLEDESLNDRIIEIVGDGTLKIENSLAKKDATFENGFVSIRINKEVAIANIPLVAWEFYIGGYQPCQKWLKDRVGRELSRNDLKHYNRIVNALSKTDVIMQEIDEVFSRKNVMKL